MSTYRFGPPPPSDLEVRPTDDDVAFFEENGYLVVDRITTDEELEWLTLVFEAFIDEGGRTFRPGRSADDTGPVLLEQSIAPEIEYPELLETTYRRNALHFASALLGRSEAELGSWGHMIRKAANGGLAAPWHQDEAYWEPELDYHAVAVWLPLHDVSVERGAMQFVPGSHKGPVLSHHHCVEPAGNLIEAEGFDASDAVACPLSAGGATFHHHRTLHHTAPNTTGLPRLAYPMEFQVPPTRRSEPRSMPWMDEFRAATGHHGGLLTYIANGRILTVD